MAAPQRDSLSLERVAVYEQQNNQPIMESDWARIWINRVKRKFQLRISEANNNVALRMHLVNLLNAAEQVFYDYTPNQVFYRLTDNIKNIILFEFSDVH